MTHRSMSRCVTIELNLTLEMHGEGRKEGNVLFNDALNTFYLRLYGVRHMVKDHSDSKRGNFFQLAARVLLYASSHRQDNTNLVRDTFGIMTLTILCVIL